MRILSRRLINATSEAVLSREAGAQEGDGSHDAIGEAADYFRRLPRGTVLVAISPTEAAALLHATNNSLEDPDFRVSHLTAKQRIAADTLASVLHEVALPIYKRKRTNALIREME